MHPGGINWIWEPPPLSTHPPTSHTHTRHPHRRSTRTDKQPPTPPRPPLFQSCLAEMSDSAPTHQPHPVGSSVSLTPLTHSLTRSISSHSESQHTSRIQLFPWQPRFLHVWSETANLPLLLIQRLPIDWSSLRLHTHPPAEHVRASADCKHSWCDCEHFFSRFAANKGGGALKRVSALVTSTVFSTSSLGVTLSG